MLLCEADTRRWYGGLLGVGDDCFARFQQPRPRSPSRRPVPYTAVVVSPAPASSIPEVAAAAGEYLVRLSSFQGPMDLLLYLIRRAELDIHDVPIAEITDQYLDFVRRDLAHVDMEEAGDFIVMAATLIQIKARLLAPARMEEGEAGAEAAPSAPLDPRAELIHALLAYQRYRSAGEWIQARREEFRRRFSVRLDVAEHAEVDAVVESGEADLLEIEDLHLLDIAEAYERIVGSIDFARLGDHRVVDEDTPIALHQEDLLERLTSSTDGAVTLQSVFEGRTRLEVVGLFLAMLELARQQRLVIEGESLDEELRLRLREE